MSSVVGAITPCASAEAAPARPRRGASGPPLRRRRLLGAERRRTDDGDEVRVEELDALGQSGRAGRVPAAGGSHWSAVGWVGWVWLVGFGWLVGVGGWLVGWREGGREGGRQTPKGAVGKAGAHDQREVVGLRLDPRRLEVDAAGRALRHDPRQAVHRLVALRRRRHPDPTATQSARGGGGVRRRPAGAHRDRAERGGGVRRRERLEGAAVADHRARCERLPDQHDVLQCRALRQHRLPEPVEEPPLDEDDLGLRLAQPVEHGLVAEGGVHRGDRQPRRQRALGVAVWINFISGTTLPRPMKNFY
eukprot:SAG11_NODE_335_length_10564_cov_23.976015_5_plen_305_part_00